MGPFRVMTKGRDRKFNHLESETSVPCSVEGRGGGGGREGRFAAEAAGKEASDSGLYSEGPAWPSWRFALRHPTPSHVFPDVSG